VGVIRGVGVPSSFACTMLNGSTAIRQIEKRSNSEVMRRRAGERRCSVAPIAALDDCDNCKTDKPSYKAGQRHNGVGCERGARTVNVTPAHRGRRIRRSQNLVKLFARYRLWL
jgi:hypothetical protein